MELHWLLCCYVYTVLCILPNTFGSTMQVFTAEDLCSDEVGASEPGGTIEFKSWSRHVPEKECVMRLNARDDRSRLQLNFTEVLFSFYSSDSVLQILDGDRNAEAVEGLPHEITRIDSSELLKPSSVYLSTGSYVTVIFRRLPINDQSSDNSFKLNFISFHVGNCGTEEYTCDNDHCIDKSVRCQKLNPCGDNSDCKNEEGKEDSQNIFDKLSNIIQDLVPYIIGLFVLYILYHLYQKFSEKYPQFSVKSLLCGSRGTQNAMETGRGDNSRRVSQESVRLHVTDNIRSRDHDGSLDGSASSLHNSHVSLHNREANRDPILHGLSDETNDFIGTNDGGHGTYSYPEPLSPPTAASNTATVQLPPPSYEEVMGNKDVYRP